MFFQQAEAVNRLSLCFVLFRISAFVWLQETFYNQQLLRKHGNSFIAAFAFISLWD